MCMCSRNHTNHGGCSGCMSECGSRCFSLGPFRGVRPGCSTPPNTGSIIPFSSGITPVTLTTVVGGTVSLPTLIGFGTATAPGVAIVDNVLDLTGVPLNEAFSVPRNGNITAISASFTATAPVDVSGTATVTAQVYRAPAGSSVFTATNAVVNLSPSFTGPLAVGDTASGSANVAPVPVTQGDRLVMVYTIAGTGITVATPITGNASAGITIS